MNASSHAQYYPHLLNQQSANGDLGSISQLLLNSTVDITPYQIDVALFTFNSLFSKGIVLADEVGLGKNIEAGLVIYQYWVTVKQKNLMQRIATHNSETERYRNCQLVLGSLDNKKNSQEYKS